MSSIGVSQLAGSSLSEYYTAPSSASYLSDFIDNYSEDDDNDGSDNDSSSDGDDSNCGSPTVRNTLSTTGNKYPSRDSVTTIKADTISDSRLPSRTTNVEGRNNDRQIPKLSLSIPYRNVSSSSLPLPQRLPISQEHTPSSAQVVEVEMINGRVKPILPPSFSLVMVIPAIWGFTVDSLNRPMPLLTRHSWPVD